MKTPDENIFPPYMAVGAQIMCDGKREKITELYFLDDSDVNYHDPHFIPVVRMEKSGIFHATSERLAPLEGVLPKRFTKNEDILWRGKPARIMNAFYRRFAEDTQDMLYMDLCVKGKGKAKTEETRVIAPYNADDFVFPPTPEERTAHNIALIKAAAQRKKHRFPIKRRGMGR